MAKTIGRYEIGIKLGEGASGVVFRAYDTLMNRDVAIKMAKAELLNADELRLVIEEFYHEANIAGNFAHQNIVTIYDVIQDRHLEHIVMEYVPGSCLQTYLKATGPLTIEETLLIAYQSALGLAYAHYHGVIHRDIKPGNILYHPAQGIVKVMDFSIASRIEDSSYHSNGSIAYMAPEHFDTSRKITVLTDIFAFGSTIYRLLTGKYPFTNQNTAEQIKNDKPIPISNFRDDVPDEIINLVNKAMAKKDIDRFQSTAELVNEIKEIANMYSTSSLVLDASNNYLTT